MRSIVLIDDNDKLLKSLTAALREHLSADEVDLRFWEPRKDEADAEAAFEKRVDEGTALVVTDHDLTKGQLGLFGDTIVTWCQSRLIPVGDYSRGNPGALPQEPNLFELRIPTADADAAQFIAGVYRGLVRIHEEIANNKKTMRRRSAAAVVAAILGRPDLESQFALYSGRLATGGAALMDILTHDSKLKGQDVGKLLSYLVSHLLLNAILRFPGPIMSSRALTAYVGVHEAEADAVAPLFEPARYSGPFAELGPYYWLSGVDDALSAMSGEPDESETPGERHRALIEAALGRPMQRHACPRCDGSQGGFLCPFTRRTVCPRPDCSVGSNSWIPQGAVLCRIERSYYDEWAPILGL